MQEIMTEPTQFSDSSKLERILAATGAGGLTAGSVVVWYLDPATNTFFPGCPLYSLTGFACPGCGLTRGFHALFHGDVIAALDYNAMLPFFGVLVGFGFLSLVYFALKGRRIPVNLVHPNFLWIFFVLMLVFGVTRNLPWYPFTVLFP
jgi:hypothetical protein